MSQEDDERKATEQLLSGFDRPGRTPRAPRVKSRDFVEYYSGRDAAVPEAPAEKREETKAHEKPTVIVPRRSGFRTTMTWIVAVVGMILFGVTIAVLSTPQVPPASSPPPTVAMPTMAPTSATTITSADPQPADTAETPDTAITSPQSPAKKTLPSTTITAGTTTPPTMKTAPRDDFIRDL